MTHTSSEHTKYESQNLQYLCLGDSSNLFCAVKSSGAVWSQENGPENKAKQGVLGIIGRGVHRVPGSLARLLKPHMLHQVQCQPSDGGQLGVYQGDPKRTFRPCGITEVEVTPINAKK